MSVTTGTEIPERIVRLFDGTDLEAKVGLGFLLVTVDNGGRPRPCLLSAGELLATGPSTIRIGLWSGTSTARNLENGSEVLFCFITAGTVCYLRGRATPLRVDPQARLECFEFRVELVETDEHPGLPVTGGVTFTVADPDPVTLLAIWAEQLAAIRDAEPVR
jgi:hypothetical protein